MLDGRKRHSAQFKAKVAVEAVRGVKTTNELAAQYEVHPAQIAKWKGQLTAGAATLFADRRRRGPGGDEEELKARLYQEIGQLKVELDWLKKKSGLGG